MSLPLALLYVLGGLAVLALGGDVLVRGAVSLARLAGLTTAVIGLTVVALGTSLPELVVSMLAAWREEPGIAVGNVVGSNTFNLLGTLGLAAILRPLPVHGNAVKLEWPVMMAASAISALLLRDLLLDRIEGIFLCFLLVCFVAFSVWLARREVRAIEKHQIEEEAEARLHSSTIGSLGLALALVVTGLASLLLGGRLLIDGSIEVARIAGLSESVIGLTIVAVGTGAPELAASIMAARRGHSDIAIANLLGSNIFNALGILGMTASVAPISVDPEILRRDIWWMLGSAAALFPVMRAGKSVSRVEGSLMLASYVVYVFWLLR